MPKTDGDFEVTLPDVPETKFEKRNIKKVIFLRLIVETWCLLFGQILRPSSSDEILEQLGLMPKAWNFNQVKKRLPLSL